MNQLEKCIAEYYGEKVLLYNYLSNDYRNQMLRQQALAAIVIKINNAHIVNDDGQVILANIDLVRETYNRLRAQYRNVQRRVRQGLNPDDLQGRDRDVYERMSFLAPYVHSEDGAVMFTN